MIKKVQIKNFRSCKDISLSSLTGLTVMLGRNGAGKTNILRAIDWAAHAAVANTVNLDDAWGNSSRTSVKLEFTVNKKSYQYIIALKKVAEQNNSYSLSEEIKIKKGKVWSPLVKRGGETLEVLGHDVIYLQAESMTSSLTLIFSLITDENTLKSLAPVRRYLSNIHYYPIDEVSDIGSSDIKNFILNEDEYSKWLSNYRTSPDTKSSVIMKIVHLWKEEKEKFDELKELLGQNGLSIINDIRIDSFELKGAPDDTEEQTYYFINFYPNLESNDINKRLKYSNLSYGTKRVLRMLTAMLHDNSTVLLLEQPEDGVHSGLLNKLVPLLQSYVDPSQFIVTSHASGIIDKLSAKDIRLVAMKDAKTIARALNKIELDAIDSFICEEGSLSDFLESIEDN